MADAVPVRTIHPEPGQYLGAHVWPPKWLLEGGGLTVLGLLLYLVVLRVEIRRRERAEAQARHGEAFLSTVLETAGALVMVLDREGRIVRFNRTCEVLSGYRFEEVKGKRPWEFLLDPADVGSSSAKFRMVAGGGAGCVGHENHWMAKDGSRHLIAWSCASLPDARGEVEYIIATGLDITDRHKAEEALRRREEGFKEAQRLAQVGSWEWDAKSDAVAWSEEMYRLSGRDPAGPPPIFGEHGQLFTRESFQRLNAAVDRALRTGMAYELDLDLVRPDGATRCLIGRGEVMRDASGRITGMHGTAQDITERKRAEEALQRVNRLLDTVVNNTHLLMACLDAGFNFIWVNRAYAQADGRLPAFFPGQNHFTLYPNAENEAIFRRVVETGVPSFFDAKPFEYPDRPERGTTYWDWGLIPVKDAAGKVERLVFTLLDVTARVQAEEALRESDRRKDEFIATLAHELRNPLAPISNALQLLRRSDDRSAIGQALGMAERQVGQLVRLVDDLLDVSRINRGKIVLRKERVALQAVIQAAQETARPHIDAGGHWVTVDLPEEPVYLDADLTRLAQAVANLLINAAKYTEAGGHIRLTASHEDDQLLIAVQDTGIGIPEAQLGKVFELFAQIEQPRQHTRSGLGIGLALARSLVELHGGSIRAASAGVGQGSTFTIHLPLGAQSPTGEPASGKREAIAMPSSQHRRILVVDDDADVADSMTMLLQTCGHEVHTAYEGESAIRTALELRPEVVLLDIGMPGMDGYEVVRRLRTQPELRGTLLVALTGWGQDADRRRSQEAGFDHHLVKPVDLAVLEALLGACPRSADARQQV